MRIRKDFVCSECGHQYEDMGSGGCYICGGAVIPIDEVGEEETEYSDDLMEETENTPPEELDEELEEEEKNLEE